MEVRPGYKQTEVGVIPEDWNAVPLGDLGKFKNGINKNRESFGYGSPFVNLMDVFGVSRIVSNEALGLVATNAVEQQTSVKPSGVGLTAVVEKDLPGTVYSGFLIRYRDNGKLSDSFKQHCFYEEGFRRRVIGASSVSANTNINQDNLRRLALILPPSKVEQEAIADALSDADALIETLEQLLVKKRQIKQGAMQELLAGKKRLPGFSGEWEVKPLSDLFDFSGGFTASRDQLSSEGYCYLHYGDIHGSKKSFVDVRSEYPDIPKLNISLQGVSSASLLVDGDVVFVDASEDVEGTSRHVVIINPDGIPFISGLHTIVAKSKADVLEHRYRRYCFQTTAVQDQFRFFAVGTKVSGISKANIARVTLPVPSVSEQTAIAAILSDMDAEIAAQEAKLAKARSIKQGMMQELLTGKIRLV
ncbi:MAG: restriction endonuclease subunit S [Chloroflexi bacterium]|nr:restriction endonuclease subunit S [Chloroflexota bacterium]